MKMFIIVTQRVFAGMHRECWNLSWCTRLGR